MRSAIAWSHDLLSPDEQSLFRCLAIFAGGCTIEAAEMVCGPLSDGPVLDGIIALIEHGLLSRTEGSDGEPRVAMLETIHEYASEQLSGSGEEQAISAAHMAWCLDLAERAAPFWFTPGQAEWGDRLEAEHDNLRAALSRSSPSPGDGCPSARRASSGRSGSFAATTQKVAHGWSRCWRPTTIRGRLIMSVC